MRKLTTNDHNVMTLSIDVLLRSIDNALLFTIACSTIVLFSFRKYNFLLVVKSAEPIPSKVPPIA